MRVAELRAHSFSKEIRDGQIISEAQQTETIIRKRQTETPEAGGPSTQARQAAAR
jgi:hypothetical protein